MYIGVDVPIQPQYLIMSLKISVIIPTYKPQSYLWECLDSITSQTFPREEFEVVLVLNGCKEPWDSAIRDYLLRHPQLNVNYIHTAQAGVSNARNIGLDVAKGEYIAFVDDDDYVSSSYLEELYDRSSEDTMALSYPYVYIEGQEDSQITTDRITKSYDRHSLKCRQPYVNARKYFSGPCMKLIPKRYIQDRRFDVKFRTAEDSLFMFLISDCFANVDFTSKGAVYYRRMRKNSAVTSKYTLSYILHSTLMLLAAYSQIYLSAPSRYSLRFYLLRLGATVKRCVHMLKTNL